MPPPKPSVPDSTAIAEPIRSARSSSRRIAMLIGYRANDAACSTRATISNANVDVVAASSEPTSTTASTLSSTRLLRCRSARRPINGVAAAAASRFAVTAQLTATIEAPSWSAITPSTGTTAVCRTATVSTTTLRPTTSVAGRSTATPAPIVSWSSISVRLWRRCGVA